ncbi:MAG: DUF4382 domain-containing protein [Gammaproteobacteria bacterium]|nr:MAG: DUF4382 domain-containing protein [Gammaproteobacteria bacterium]
MTVVRTRRSPARKLPALACALVMLASCGGSSNTPLGTLVVTLSDTSGDFASYRVQIDSISLTNTNGTVWTLHPWLAGVSELADLAALTDGSELLVADAVPSGTYKSATLVLDYLSASVWVNLNGQALAASVVNSKGTAPTTSSVTVTFDPSDQLTITSGKSSRLAVDIDLAASNSIDTSGSTPKVTVQPYAVMRPAPADASSMRARGLLVIVESASNDYISNTRPLTDQSSAVGAVTVSTDANTYFNVDGTAYTGASGLAAMAALTTNTPVAAYGTLGDMSGITPGFHATAVYAGTSLETLADHVTGVVSARSGNTLTVRGAHLFQRLGAACAAYPDAFYNNATVTIGSATTVSEDGVMATGLTPASISVGQQLDVSGQCSVDSAGNLSLDAATCMVGGTPTPCQARLASSRIWGTLSSATPGSAVLDVLTIGNFAPGGFNFTGTGTPMAAPAAYVVNTGTLDESGVAAAHPLLQVDGIVSPFGAAPPDFHATAIALGSATEQRLVVEWVNGGAPSPFISASSTGLVVDLNNANLGTIHEIRTGPATLDLKPPPPASPLSPLITTTGANQSNLELSIGSATLTSGISVFHSASAFAGALSSTLNGTNKIYRLVAVGQLNAAANTFVASRISVALYE